MCNVETKEVDPEIAQPVNFSTNVCKQNVKKLHLLFVNAHTKICFYVTGLPCTSGTSYLPRNSLVYYHPDLCTIGADDVI